MSETDPQFTGTFAGEEAAIAKYAAHHGKQSRKPPKKAPLSSWASTFVLRRSFSSSR